VEKQPEEEPRQNNEDQAETTLTSRAQAQLLLETDHHEEPEKEIMIQSVISTLSLLEAEGEMKNTQ